MSASIALLDHGYVRLVDHMGTDLSIVRNARVSHDAAWRTGEDAGKDEKLIKYLYFNKHNTPFESVRFTFEVKAPIFVFRQWHRHRTWSYNEVSARYTALPEEFYVPSPEHLGVQSGTNHQARTIQSRGDAEHITCAMREHNSVSFALYKQLLKEEVPRELARTVLPVATYSHMFASVDLNNLLKFLDERLSEHAQYEIRVYAEALLQLITPIVPVAVAAWKAGKTQ